MQQYEEFLEHINKYFEYDEVVSKGTLISAYDLLKIITERMHEYFILICDNSDFKKAINDYYTVQVPFGKIFKKFKKVNTASVDYTQYRYEKNHAKAVIKFNGESFISSKYIRLCKDTNTDELYFDTFSEIDKEFVEHFHDQILSDLQKIEELFYLFKLTNTNVEEIPYSSNQSLIKEEISDDFLKLIISYDACGRVNSKIIIDPSVDPDNIYGREWLNHEPIKDYIAKHKDELLKKIAINVLDLKETTQKIITDYYAKKISDEHKLELK